MQAIILAAGYATRLYPLTENTPKPLLEVAGKPMVEHIIGKITEVKGIKKIHIVTNDKFEKHFLRWLEHYNSKIPIEIINDGTKSNEDRLGALGDVHFCIKEKSINDDLLVVAGDNLFAFSLKGIFSGKESMIVLHDAKDIKLASHYGVVEVKDKVIVDFEEKPEKPKSTLVSTGIYFFPKKTISLIQKYIGEGNNPDKTGSFIEWLHKKEKVRAHVAREKWFDIGSLEQLEKADREHKES